MQCYLVLVGSCITLEDSLDKLIMKHLVEESNKQLKMENIVKPLTYKSFCTVFLANTLT